MMHDCDCVLQGQGPGNVSCSDLSNAVTHDCIRLNPP